MEEEKELEISELFYIFIKNIKLIGKVVGIFAILAIIYSFIIIRPMYKSTASIVVARANNPKNVNGESLNQLLISDSLIKNAIKNLDLKENSSIVKNNIESSVEKDTGAITLNVSNRNAKNANKIANEIINEFKLEVKEIHKIDKVTVLQEPSLSTKPYNINFTKNLAIFIVVGFILIYGVIFLKYYFNAKINSIDEIEKILGKNKLAVIADINTKKGKI